jgi:hypothetical protein
MMIFLLIFVGLVQVTTQQSPVGNVCEIEQFAGCLCRNGETTTCVTQTTETGRARLLQSGKMFGVVAQLKGTTNLRTLCTKSSDSYEWRDDPSVKCDKLLGFCLPDTTTRCCIKACFANMCATFTSCDDSQIGPIVPTSPTSLSSPTKTPFSFPTARPTPLPVSSKTPTTTTTAATTTTTTTTTAATVNSGVTTTRHIVDTPTTTTTTPTTTTTTTTTISDDKTTSDPYQLVATTSTSIPITSSDISSDNTLYFVLGAVGAAMLLLAVVVLIVVLVRGKSVSFHPMLFHLILKPLVE